MGREGEGDQVEGLLRDVKARDGIESFRLLRQHFHEAHRERRDRVAGCDGAGCQVSELAEARFKLGPRNLDDEVFVSPFQGNLKLAERIKEIEVSLVDDAVAAVLRDRDLSFEMKAEQEIITVGPRGVLLGAAHRRRVGVVVGENQAGQACDFYRSAEGRAVDELDVMLDVPPGRHLSPIAQSLSRMHAFCRVDHVGCRLLLDFPFGQQIMPRRASADCVRALVQYLG